LHFGDVEAGLVEPLTEAIRRISPDLIAVSGDLTQRARHWQFAAARRFLGALPAPQLVVPGNHDVPLYNLFARFRGVERYQRHISFDLEPFYADEEIAVIGLNTARSLTFKGGRLNQRQMARIQQRLCGLEEDLIKVVVTHHPFDLPRQYPASALVGRARMAMERLANCRIDIFLAGHFHVSLAAATAFRFQIGGRAALLVQAGTATSNRARGEANSFNVLRINRPEVSVERFRWDVARGAFVSSGVNQFRQNEAGWLRVADREAARSTVI
jgi:3',5'-cyclic AMP phosphodiesterase CpdA